MKTNIRFVADMHELVNPNKDAVKLWKELNGKMPNDRQLKELYYNSEDPLAKIFFEARRDTYSLRTPTYIISVGDMIVNRINFGEGTEKSIAGKLGKKAREQGIPQHIYIAENYKDHLKEIEEWAYRNSSWTEMRFKEIAEISKDKKVYFNHLNGNADALSSFVARELLNADFKSPNEIIANYFENNEGVYATDMPKNLFKVVNGKMLMNVMIPQTFEWKQQIMELSKLPSRSFYEKKGDIVQGILMIHEPLSYDPFSKNENIEGMDAYKTALNKMPNNTIVIHGHTHAPFTKYQFEGHNVYQIPQNTAIKLEEILK
jgi:hypothetical protein